MYICIAFSIACPINILDVCLTILNISKKKYITSHKYASKSMYKVSKK